MEAYCRYRNCLQYHISTDIVRDDAGVFVFCIFVCVCLCVCVCVCVCLSVCLSVCMYYVCLSVCTLHYYVLTFYTTEFKGYVAISCSERCVITFHSLCWRKVREENIDLQASDKVCMVCNTCTTGSCQFVWNILNV